MENAPAPAVEVTTTPAAAAPAVVCMEMSNTHLLKMDTNDTYATGTALRRLISKDAIAAGVETPAKVGNVDKGEVLFPGMIRISKNPKSPIVFFSFETAEQRQSALEIMSTHMKHRKHQLWKEVPVTDKDLQLTFRGAGGSALGLLNQKDNNKKDGDEDAPLSNRALKRQAREGDERTSNTAQWASYPYSVQISKKAVHCKSIIKQIANGRIQRLLSNYNCPQLLEQFSMIESPFLSGYRNHVNFTCGLDSERRPVIGFVAGAVLDGHVSVEDVTGRWYDEAAAAGPSPSAASGAPLVPPTTNVLSVAYAKAVMEVVKRYEKYTFVDGTSAPITYHLGMLDKGSQAQQQKLEQQQEGATGAAEEEGSSEPAAKRGARLDDGASSSVTHQFWRRVQIRHSTVGDTMIDLEVDPSAIPEGLKNIIRDDLIATLRDVEKTFDGAAAEAAENAYLTSKVTSSATAAAANETDKPDSHRLVTALKRPLPLVIPSVKLVSLQWHFHSGTTMCAHEAPRETIFGSSTLVENLCGMKFLLSPPSFFQVNTPTTERMLERVAEVAQLKPTTTLLDLCCGTGIIGICLSKFVKKIVGVEMVVSAVENAKVNAANNSVSEKTTYYAAKVEDALTMAMSTLTNEEKQDVVAIFDPPRAGMHPSVLCAVRSMPQIRRIVYISCDQQALVRDCPSLMKEPTKKFRGTPYVIDGTFGIDLFPHTPHVEMVVVLNKITNEQMEKFYDMDSKYRVKETATDGEAAPAVADDAPANSTVAE